MEAVKTKELNRKYLTKILSGVLEKPAAIVTAPSGYGKTTIVRNFLQNHKELQCVWLSMGREEVDEVWAWKKLCNKLQEQDIKIHEQMNELGLPKTVREIDYFIRMVRESIQGSFYLILDDFHECTSSAINYLLSKIIYEEVPGLHIILISCKFPDIPYEEMLLKGYCVILDQQALMLSKQEIAQIFAMNGIRLQEDEVDKIYTYTDGWISAVYLILFDFQREGHFGYFAGVPHLLKTAIFDKAPKQMQKFCMKMSLFDDFTLEEAVYITEQNISPLAITEVMNQYGFMLYDRDSRKYQMHTLLRSVSAAELENSGESENKLYERCGDWCEKGGNYIKAIINYSNAGKTEKIFALLSGEKNSIIFEEAPSIVGEFFESVSVSIRAKYPVAYLCYIYYVVVKENAIRGKEMFLEISKEYENNPVLQELKESIKGELLILDSLHYFNDLFRINAAMAEAYRLLSYKPSNMFRQNLLTYGTPNMTMLYYRQKGELKETIEQEKEYAKYHMRLVGRGEEDWDDYFDAEHALITGHIEEAEGLALIVCDKAKFRKQTCIIISSYFILLRCLIFQGKEQEFYCKIREFEMQMKGIVRPILQMDYELAYSYVYANIGRNDKVVDWIRNFDIEKCSRLVRNARIACIVYGISLINSSQWVLLEMLAEQILVPYESTRHQAVIIHAYIFKAIAAYRLGKSEKARNYLLTALDMAEKDEVKVIFVEQGCELLPIMDGICNKNPFYISVKEAMKKYKKVLKRFSKESEKVLLTAREMELMQLVKEGYRNIDIGEKMNIALVTVEKTLTNIYRKMNVSNRAAAIAKLKDEYYGFP